MIERTKNPKEGWSLDQLADHINSQVKQTAAIAWRIGEDLAIARNRFKPDGEFLAWLEKAVDISQATAYRYMKIHEDLSYEQVENLSVNAAIKLVAPVTREAAVRDSGKKHRKPRLGVPTVGRNRIAGNIEIPDEDKDDEDDVVERWAVDPRGKTPRRLLDLMDGVIEEIRSTDENSLSGDVVKAIRERANDMLRLLTGKGLIESRNPR